MVSKHVLKLLHDESLIHLNIQNKNEYIPALRNIKRLLKDIGYERGPVSKTWNYKLSNHRALVNIFNNITKK